MTPSTADRYQRVDALFDAVLDRPAEEQLAYLEREAAGDADLHSEVLHLLRAHERAEGFLEGTSPRVARDLLEAADLIPAAAPPEHVGPWRILRPLGRGGMGVVFVGERDDGHFEQRVAVKLIQHATPGLVGRFLEERRILAMLEHPGIGRLIDGGVTPDGLPYFAMELIEGMHLDRYCEEHSLSMDRRLELLEQVCEAVSYAHHHLVIHRDLKPSNILVTPEGRVKLLDFGIAKLLSAGKGVTRADTRAQVMTPEFAAPEQVRGEPVSTATDVYALGVVLYLLLSGSYPYEVRNSSPAELVRIVGEKEPARPSTRAPAAFRRRLRGDLDLIVMTALHKDPRRRYQSPAALAEDLRRFREDRPVLARPDSTGYRFRKFVGRHPAGIAAGVLAVGLLAGGAARERVLRTRAEVEARKAAEVGDYLVGVFDVADPYSPERSFDRDVSARTLLDQGVRRVDSGLAGQPEVQAEVRGVLGRAYTSLGIYDRAVELLRRSLEQQRALHGEDHPAAVTAMERLGDALTEQDRYDEAEPLLREVVEQRRRRYGSASDSTARALDRLATLYQRRSELDRAEPLFREALAIRRKLFGDTAVVVGESLNNLGVLLFLRGAYEESEAAQRESVAIRIRGLGENHPRTAQALHNLAQALTRRGKTAEAETLYRRALAAKRKTLGDVHPSVTINLNNLGMLLVDTGRPEEAELLFREALALDRRIFGEAHSYVAASLGNLATARRHQGELADAERLHREAMAINLKLFGPEHIAVINDLNTAGHLRRFRGDVRGSLRYYREAVELGRRVLGTDHLNTISYEINLGRALLAAGESEEAVELLRSASERVDSTAEQERGWYLTSEAGLGLALARLGRVDEGRRRLESALALSRRHLGEQNTRTADLRLSLGQVLMAAREDDRAEEELRAAAAYFQPLRKRQPMFAAEAEAALVELGRRR